MMLLAGFSNLAVAQEDADDADEQKLYWVFLTTGKSTQHVEQTKIQEMQRAHLQNFGRLVQQGSLLAVGPLGSMSDADRPLRGMVVIKTASLEKLNQMFESDPYVAKGYMRVEASQMNVALGAFKTPSADPSNLEELRIVVLRHRDCAEHQMSTEQKTQHKKMVTKLFESNELRMAVELKSSERRMAEILVFNKLDERRMGEILRQLPAVAEQFYSATALHLYVAQGVIR